MDSNNNELDTKQNVEDKKVENKAIVSMVLGIASIVGCVFAGPIALICGIIAMVMGSKVKKVSNNGCAKAGFITGLIGTILTTLILIIIIAMLVVGKNILDKYSDGSLTDKLFNIEEKYEKEQNDDGNVQDDESVQDNLELTNKKAELDKLNEEIASLNEEILTAKNNGDTTKLFDLQQKLVELTKKVMELESEILELEN